MIEKAGALGSDNTYLLLVLEVAKRMFCLRRHSRRKGLWVCVAKPGHTGRHEWTEWK